jgi:hypothetical protein
MYKVIMHLATIDFVATTQTLQDNLQNLSVFAAMVSGNIDKINTEFNKNYSQIFRSRGDGRRPTQHPIQRLPCCSLLPLQNLHEAKA